MAPTAPVRGRGVVPAVLCIAALAACLVLVQAHGAPLKKGGNLTLEQFLQTKEKTTSSVAMSPPRPETVISGVTFIPGKYWERPQKNGAILVGEEENFQSMMIVGSKQGTGEKGRWIQMFDTVSIQRLVLGKKWTLSGVGDPKGDDNWLRLMEEFPKPNYRGGMAAMKFSAHEFYHNSDGTIKKNVETIEDALERVVSMRGVRYEHNDKLKAMGIHEAAGKRHVGLIAQEVEEVFPEVVGVGPEGTKVIDYAKLAGPLIQALKQQHEHHERLRATVKAHEANITAQDERIALLEEKMAALL